MRSNVLQRFVVLALCALAFAAAAGETDTGTWSGTLERHGPYGAIRYLGEESGDVAVFYFRGDSVAGRKIEAACKAGARCAFAGTIEFADPPRKYFSARDLDGVSATALITQVRSARTATPLPGEKQ